MIKRIYKRFHSLVGLRRGIFIPLAIVFSGCTQLNVTYFSDPPGADIVISGVNRGPGPVRLNYPLTKEQESAGRLSVQAGYAQWRSGATKNVPSITLDLTQGMVHHFRFVRPSDSPGIQVDIDYANQLRAARLEQQRRAEQLRQQQAREAVRRAEEEERNRLERQRIKAIRENTEAIRNQNRAKPIYNPGSTVAPVCPWPHTNCR